MDAGANVPLKKLFKKKYGQKLYEQEFSRVKKLGFNTLGGWSNTQYLKNRMPYGIVLFDDPDHPLNSPLKDFEGKKPPFADSDVPCPIGDPYDPGYIEAVKKYLGKYVGKVKNDERLLMYWIGAEFGLGDTNAIDFSKYIYSSGVQKEFQTWLQSRYRTLTKLNKNWNTKFTSFQQAAATKPLKSYHYKNDTLDFSVKVIRDWFQLVVGEIRKIAPNHLIGSPKISIWDYEPFLDRPIKLKHFETFKGFFDVFSIDWYSGKPTHKKKGLNQLIKISRELKQPIIIGEWGIRQDIDGWSNTPGARSLVETQKERGKNYATQLLSVFKHPEFVGAHWFRWQDHIIGKHQFNKGMIKPKEGSIVEYSELTKSMQKVHHEINTKIKELVR